MKFTKNGDVKILSPESSIIPLLLADGWENADAPKKPVADESGLDKDALVEEAKSFGINFHPNIGAEKLLERINEAKADIAAKAA